METTKKQIFNHYATLLSYPGDGIETELQRCRDLLAEDCSQAAQDLEPLLAFLAWEGKGRLEELYTATFDLRPSCCPYVAVHLCGESRARTLFLLKLKDLYREYGFASGADLGDHIGVMLRFVACNPDAAGSREIIEDALLPALERMTASFAEDAEQPYGALLRSLQNYLNEALSGPQAIAGKEEVTACRI
ncbi:MAG: nitrate reductase molybdenum cofactor assembly chaperone [Desulfuromonadales bacterium]